MLESGEEGLVLVTEATAASPPSFTFLSKGKCHESLSP